MARTTILSVGTSNATSTDFTVAAGSQVSVGMFVASGALPSGAELTVLAATPGASVAITRLSAKYPMVSVNGPGTYRVTRRNQAVGVGVFTEDGA